MNSLPKGPSLAISCLKEHPNFSIDGLIVLPFLLNTYGSRTGLLANLLKFEFGPDIEN